MKELLEEEEKKKAAAFVGSQKKEQAKAGRSERIKEKEDQQKEETDFFRVWREPIERLEKVKGKRNSEENVECRRVGVRTKPRWVHRGW
jgi:hypothetical protein